MDALGDTILTTPFLEEIRRRFPRAELHVIASERGAPALEGNPAVDEIIVLSPSELTPGSIFRTAASLKKRKYDVSITVSEKRPGYVLPFLASIPVRIGFTPGFSQPLKALLCKVMLTHRVFSPNDPSRPSKLHETERYARLLQPLGIHGEPGPLRVFPGEEAVRWAESCVAGRRHADLPEPVSLHLTKKWIGEGWDESMLVECLNLIVTGVENTQFLITFGEEEKSWAGRLIEKLPSERIIPFSDPSFQRWAAAIAQSRLLVTMDTAASHVAAALGLPVVDIFGEKYCTHRAGRWHPWKVEYGLIRKPSLAARKSSAEKAEVLKEFSSQVIAGIKQLSASKRN